MSTGSSPNRGFSTTAVHGGEDRKKFGDSLTTPIVQTSTFVFHDAKDVHDYTSKTKFRFEYGRYGTPTQLATERKLAALEGARDCLLFASGMSAITTTLLALLSKGQHLVITDDVYKKTLQFCQNDMPRFGIECTITPMGDYQALEDAVRPNTRVLFSESPTNPYLNILDMKKFVAIGKKHRLTTIVDSTFATPVNQQPLAFGVDIVIHSGTKYLGGHNDLLAGAVLGKERYVNEVRDFQKTTGGVIDPHCCYLLLRGLKTLSIRVARQNETALTVAKFLEKHPRIKRVYYPGLKSHRDHKIAKTQMRGFGGVVTFDVDADMATTERVLEHLKLCYVGPSLGGVETLITHPASISYYDMTRDERYAIGITDGLVRLAVGVEDAEDIIADLEQALTGVFKKP